MSFIKKAIVTMFLVFVSLSVGLQLFARPTGEYSEMAVKIRSKKKEDRNFRVTPFVAPGYTPELGFVIAGGALFSFSTEFENKELPRSSISTSLSFGVSGNYTVSVIGNTYWLNDKLRVPFDIWVKDMPDEYFGVGYENARNTPEGDDTTSYDRFWWLFNPRVLWQFREKLFAGVNLDLNQTKASNMSPGVANDPFVQEQGTDNYNTGLGVIFMHDSRDMPVNAYSGWYLMVSATFYGEYLGGDNVYQIYEIDYRQYQQIVRPGSTLAWTIYSRTGTGPVPWPEMSQVGSPFDLRGYRWGQYRDRAGLYAIVEYRFKFMTDKPNRLRPYEGRKESRHGLVGWVGFGAIGDDWGLQWGNYMPNFGFGYRFEVQPRMNARIDVGWGYKTRGIYFNFNEAF